MATEKSAYRRGHALHRAMPHISDGKHRTCSLRGETRSAKEPARESSPFPAGGLARRGGSRAHPVPRASLSHLVLGVAPIRMISAVAGIYSVSPVLRSRSTSPSAGSPRLLRAPPCVAARCTPSRSISRTSCWRILSSLGATPPPAPSRGLRCEIGKAAPSWRLHPSRRLAPAAFPILRDDSGSLLASPRYSVGPGNSHPRPGAGHRSGSRARSWNDGSVRSSAGRAVLPTKP